MVARPKAGRATGKTGTDRARVAMLEGQACRLRAKGYTLQEIADFQGVTLSTARERVLNAIQRIPTEAAEEVKKLELERLDNLFRELWPKALKGQYPAVDRCLRIMERRAKLLGLDQAERHSVLLETISKLDDVPDSERSEVEKEALEILNRMDF